MKYPLQNFLAFVIVLGLPLCAASTVHYVDVNSTNATPPYANWTTAATNIQDAVDAALAGDEIVVTNGTYHPVRVNTSLSLRSVNGLQFTAIDGGHSSQCVYLTDSATVSGFTLTNGYYGVGAGAAGGTLNNCTIVNNGAGGGGGGGGAAYCTLNNCTLTGNSVLDGNGGGAAYCTLNNCTLTGNSVYGVDPASIDFATGGGAYDSTLNNCILTGNSANDISGGGYATFGGGASKCTLSYCIFYSNFADWEPDYGPSTVNHCQTTDPLFVDQASGNLRLRPNSPCISAGNNSYVTKATDLDGNPRISGGTVDIGAYEFQWPQLTITPSDTNVVLTWPTNNLGYDCTGFSLQSTTNLVSPAVWSTNSAAPVVIDSLNVITNPIAGPQQFYRLFQ